MMNLRQNILLRQRIPEPELMTAEDQVAAYAEADFAEAHEAFVDQFGLRFSRYNPSTVIDLACGPGDVIRRFARRYPNAEITALDGSEPMISYACRSKDNLTLHRGIVWDVARIPLPPDSRYLQRRYDAVLSNSLLHHLLEPQTLWETVRAIAHPGTRVLIGDLIRPKDTDTARTIVSANASKASSILQRDFHASLCAAFTVTEVILQLERFELDWLQVEQTSDRHMVIFGVRS